MKYGLLLFLLIALPCFGQTATTGKAETTGACSPAVSGNKNTLVIKCQGLTHKQGEEILKMLNKLAKDPNHGFLVPSKEPFPLNSCPPGLILDSDTRVYYGSNVSVIRAEQSFSIINIAGNPLLWARVTPDGLKISGIMYSEDGAVVLFDDNEFWLNGNTTFHSENPDPHTLIVRDKWAQEVLKIRYLNPKAIKVTGRFYYPGRPPVIVDENTMKFRGNSFSDGCNAGQYSGAIGVN